jgi:hypothetical protein
MAYRFKRLTRVYKVHSSFFFSLFFKLFISVSSYNILFFLICFLWFLNHFKNNSSCLGIIVFCYFRVSFFKGIFSLNQINWFHPPTFKSSSVELLGWTQVENLTIYEFKNLTRVCKVCSGLLGIFKKKKLISFSSTCFILFL